MATQTPQQPNKGGKKNPFEAKTLDEASRRMLINNYFKINHVEFPSLKSPRMILVYIGVFMGFVLIFYLKRAIPTVIFSSSCFIFAFWHFYRFIVPYYELKRMYATRPDEEQMGSWLIKDLKETVKPKAIELLSLNMSDIKPENFIIIPVPIYWETPAIPTAETIRKANSDGTFLYSIWRVQILALTQHYISLYKCDYNWLTNSMVNQTTNEFYFDDITSIRNDVQNLDLKPIDNPEGNIGNCKVFNVANISGENITVINDIPLLKGPKNVAVNLEYVVSLLRMILRNRRFGIEHEPTPKEEDEKQEQQTKAGQMADVVQHNYEIEQKGALYSDQQPGINDPNPIKQ